MNTLAEYLWMHLSEWEAQHLLLLYPNNDAVKILLAECPEATYCDLLAQALYSGAKPILPKFDANKSGIYPAIEEE